MGFLHSLRLKWSPPRKVDPDFGELTFMYFSNAPERSYWEAEWTFPPTGTKISIALAGNELGPNPSAREFHLALPQTFHDTMNLVRPELDRVFLRWYGRPIAQDIWQDVSLAGFGLDAVNAQQVQWDVSFEATGEKWLGITVPIHGDRVLEAIIDT